MDTNKKTLIVLLDPRGSLYYFKESNGHCLGVRQALEANEPDDEFEVSAFFVGHFLLKYDPDTLIVECEVVALYDYLKDSIIGVVQEYLSEFGYTSNISTTEKSRDISGKPQTVATILNGRDGGPMIANFSVN